MFKVTFSSGNISCCCEAETIEGIIALVDAMSAKADDEWIEWSGGKRPVEGAASVQVKLRDGTVRNSQAEKFAWWNDGNYDDIVAYRVVES